MSKKRKSKRLLKGASGGVDVMDLIKNMRRKAAQFPSNEVKVAPPESWDRVALARHEHERDLERELCARVGIDPDEPWPRH